MRWKYGKQGQFLSQVGLFGEVTWDVLEGDIILKELWSVLKADARKFKGTVLPNSLA